MRGTMKKSMKKSIKKSIKPPRTLQSKTRKKKMIYQLLNEIYQSLDEANKIYPQYSTNPKNDLRIKKIIYKLNKKLDLTKKAYFNFSEQAKKVQSNLSEKLEQQKQEYNSERTMISDDKEQKSRLIKLREEIYNEEESIKSITHSIKDIELHIADIENHIEGLTNAINQIKQQQQENYHIKSLINPRDHYSNSRLGSIMNILQRTRKNIITFHSGFNCIYEDDF